MSFKKMVIPHRIQEFDDEMLIPLDRNFSEIQRHTQIVQTRMDTAESNITTLSGDLTTLNGNLTIVNNALTDHVTEPYLHGLFYNKVINGNFNINQRGVAGTVTLAANTYGHDRWRGGSAGCEYTFATVENITILTIASGTIEQVIEGNNLFSGNYVASWEGTSQLQIGGIAYDSPVIITATGGTNGVLEFGAGTLSRVQLTRGEIERDFEDRPIGLELSLCQRYYRSFLDRATFRMEYYLVDAVYFNIIGVPMRTTPTVVSKGESTTTGWNIYTMANAAQSGFVVSATDMGSGLIQLGFEKTSHGLTDGFLQYRVDSAISLDAEIY